MMTPFFRSLIFIGGFCTLLLVLRRRRAAPPRKPYLHSAIPTSRGEIERIGIDAKAGLFVKPRIGPSMNYEFIYRAGMGVAWDESTRVLIWREQDSSAPGDAFRQIVNAVRIEYGEKLLHTKDTDWTNVPAGLRLQMEAWMQQLDSLPAGNHSEAKDET